MKNTFNLLKPKAITGGTVPQNGGTENKRDEDNSHFANSGNFNTHIFPACLSFSRALSRFRIRSMNMLNAMTLTLTLTLTLALTLALTLTLMFGACSKDNGPADNGEPGCAIPAFQKTSFTPVNRPCGIAISKSGMVAICEYNGFEMYGGSYGSTGKTYVYKSYSDLLSKVAPFATLDNRGAEAVAFDSRENLYVAETEAVAGIAVYQILKNNNAASFQYQKTIQGGFVNPRGIGFDSHDRLYIANDGLGNIIRVNDPTGAAVTQSIGAIGNGLKGLAIAQDTIFCTNYSTNQVISLPLLPDGSLGQLTHAGISITHPVDICVNDRLIAVSTPESGNITFFERNGFLKADYVGCSKEISVGDNVFGLSFLKTAAGKTGLVAAWLGQNQLLYFEAKN